MARLQKKHSSKDKNKKKENIDSVEEKKSSNVILSGAKNKTSSSKKANSEKSAGLKQADKKNIFQQSIDYLQEVQSELKKVTWPSRKQTMGTTLVVIVLVAIVSAFLGLFDYGFSMLIQAVLA